MQTTSAFQRVEISRWALASLMVAPLAALILGGAGGYALKTVSSMTAPPRAQIQQVAAPVPAAASPDFDRESGQPSAVMPPRRNGLQTP